MDPVVLQLLMQMSQAKSGNRNLSGTLNNMDNPLLLALAGVLDPMSMQGASQGGGVYGSFRNDPNTPETVQQVMDWVDQGLNKYQIESMINAQLPDAVVTDSGYTKKQLISMASEMSKQRASGTDKSGIGKLTQAGFRNPNDVYGLEDVPLSANSQARIGELQTQYSPLEEKMANQESRTKIAANKMRGFSPDTKSELSKNIIRDSRTMATGMASVALRELAKYVDSNPYVTVEDLNKQVDLISSSTSAAPREVETYKRNALRRIGKVSKTATKGSEDVGTNRAQSIGDWEMAKIEEGKIGVEASNNARLQEAIRQANLNQAAQAGRTPFTDQASQLMKFIAGTK
jgi:hypothetical protein